MTDWIDLTAGPNSMSAKPSDSQWSRFVWDMRVVSRHRRSRWWSVPFSEATAIIAFYRFNRAGFLAFGRAWSAARTALAPLNVLIRLVVTSELDYRSDIGAGMRILHPQLGVVVSAGTTAGTGLILAGGNAIGGSGAVLGNHVQLGINATIIGAVKLGDHVTVGAGAVVVNDFVGPGVLVGVPAAPTTGGTL